jgi:aryl carrier-like protein
MSYEEWIGAVKPKVDGAWNLHNALSGHDLDFFILASSLVALVDQPGQANYAAGNCFLESFCQFRRSNGLPCSVLGLCPLADAGFVAENPTVQRKLRSTGFYLMPEQQVLDFFQLGMVNQHDTDVESNDSNGVSDSLSPWMSAGYLILGLHSEVHLDDPKCQAGWRRDRRMGTYHNIQDATDAAGGSTESPLKSFLARVADQPEILDEEESIITLATEIGRRILSFLLKEDSGLDISMGVAEIGVDSLMAIELRRWWKQTFGLDITVFELLSPGTVHRLGQVASQGLKQKFSG